MERTIKKRRGGLTRGSSEAFDIFSQEEDSEICGNSWCDLWMSLVGLSVCDSVTWTSLPVINDVLSWKFVEPQSFFCLSPTSVRLFVQRIKER